MILRKAKDGIGAKINISWMTDVEYWHNGSKRYTCCLDADTERFTADVPVQAEVLLNLRWKAGSQVAPFIKKFIVFEDDEIQGVYFRGCWHYAVWMRNGEVWNLINDDWRAGA